MSDESLKEEILINVTPSEVRAALLENGVLQEVFIERTAQTRPHQQHLQWQGFASAARHAGGVHRHRA